MLVLRFPLKSIYQYPGTSISYKLNFQQTILHVDFEEAVMVVNKIILPSALFKFCRFHLILADQKVYIIE